MGNAALAGGAGLSSVFALAPVLSPHGHLTLGRVDEGAGLDPGAMCRAWVGLAEEGEDTLNGTHVGHEGDDRIVSVDREDRPHYLAIYGGKLRTIRRRARGR